MSLVDDRNAATEAVRTFVTDFANAIPGLLTGEKLREDMTRLYATKTQEEQAAAKQMVDAAIAGNHTLFNALSSYAQEVVKAGYIPQFAYNTDTQSIEATIARATSNFARELNAEERRFKASLPVGKSYNHMTAASGHIVAHDAKEGAYFTDYSTALLEQMTGVLRNINDSPKQRINKADAKRLFTARSVAQRETVASFVPTPAASNRGNESIEDFFKRVGNEQRYVQTEQQLRYAPLLKAATSVKTEVYKRHRQLDAHKGQSNSSLSASLEHMAAEYLFTYQAFGENVAHKIGALYGLSDTDMHDLQQALGPALHLKSVWQGTRDEGLQQAVSTIRSNVGLPFAEAGDRSRHESQTLNYLRRAQSLKELKAVLGKKSFNKLSQIYQNNEDRMMQAVFSRPQANFRVAGMEDSPFYSGAEQQMTGVAYATQEQWNNAYREAYYEEALEALKKKYRKDYGTKASGAELQRLQEEARGAADKVLIPGLQDDASVIRESYARTLGTIVPMSTVLSPNRLRAIKAEAEQELGKEQMSDNQALSKWMSRKLFGNQRFVEDALKIANAEGSEFDSLATMFASLDQLGGDVSFSTLAAKQFGNQSKILGWLTGERTNARVIYDRLWGRILQKLGLGSVPGLSIDNIRLAKEMNSSNVVPGIARGLLSRLAYNANPNIAAKFAENPSVAPYLQYVEHMSGARGGYTFNQAQFDADLAAGKNPEIFTNILDAFADAGLYIQHSVAEDGTRDGYVPADSTPLVLADILNQANTAVWKKRVSAGPKERFSLENMFGSAGITDNAPIAAALRGRYRADSQVNKEFYDRAAQQKEAIDASLRKTFRTGRYTSDDVESLVNSSFKLGDEKRSKEATSISMGYGSQYSINLEDFENERIKFEQGKLTEEAFNASIWGRIEELKDNMIAANPQLLRDQIATFVDPLTSFGVKSEYSDEAALGRLLYLPSIPPSAQIRDGEEVYDLPIYSALFNSLAKSIKYGTNEDTAETVSAFAKGVYDQVYHKEGAVWEGLNKTRLPNSFSSTKVGAIGNDFDENDVDRLTGAFVSENRMRRILEDESGFADQATYLSNLADVAELTQEERRGLDKEQLIKAAMKVAKTKGLLGIANRFPSVDNQSLLASRLWIDSSITDDDLMLLGPALQHALKADFDGDVVNFMTALLSSDELKGMEDLSTYSRNVMMDMWRMHTRADALEGAGPGGFKLTKNAANLADNDFYNRMSALATRQNKPYTGTFSMMSTKVRNAIAQAGMAESSLRPNSTEAEKLEVAKGILTSASLQALEQDAIDGKKVGARIVEKMEKDGLSTEEAKDAVAEDILGQFERMHQAMSSGKLSYSDYIGQLVETKIFKNGRQQSLASEAAIARINQLGFKDGEVWEKLGAQLGWSPEQIEAQKEAALTGTLLQNTLMTAGEDVDTKLRAWTKAHGYEAGMFVAENGLPAIAMSSRYAPGSATSNYQMLNTMKTKGVSTSKDAFGGATNNVALSLEKLASVLDNFVARFEQIGHGLLAPQSQDWGFWQPQQRSQGVTTYLKNVVPSKYRTPGVDTRGIVQKYQDLSPEQKETFANAQSDEERAKLLGLAPEAYGAGKEFWARTAEGILSHAYLELGDHTSKESKWIDQARAFGYTDSQIKEFSAITAARAKALAEVDAESSGDVLATELRLSGEEIAEKFGKHAQTRSGTALTSILDKLSIDDEGYVTLSDAKFYANGKPTAENVLQMIYYDDDTRGIGQGLREGYKGKDGTKFQFDPEHAEEGSKFYLGDKIDPKKGGALLTALYNSKIRDPLLNIMDAAGTIRQYKVPVRNLSNEAHKQLYGELPIDSALVDVLTNLPVRTLVHDKETGIGSAFVAAKAQTKAQTEAQTKGAKQSFDSKTIQGATKAETAYLTALKDQYRTQLKIDQVQRKMNLTTNRKEAVALEKERAALRTQLQQQQQLTLATHAIATGDGSELSEMAQTKEKIIGASYASQQAHINTSQKGAVKVGDVMGNAIGSMFSGFFRFSIAYRAMFAISNQVQKVIQLTKELDATMTNLRVVTGNNAESAREMMLSYNDLAKSLGVTTKEVSASANAWLRQGYTAQETQKLITASTYLSKLGMVSQEEATKDLTAALKGFKLEAADAMSIVDKLTELDKHYAASAGEIGEALSRVSAVAQQAGMTLDEAAASVTVIMDVTQQGAQMAGTAFRTMVARFSQVKSESFSSMIADDDDMENINDVEKVLSALGIRLRKNNLEMRSWGEVMDELYEKWRLLSDVEKSAVATALGGVRQRNSVLTLLNNYDRVKEATETSEESAGTAEEKYTAYTDSVAYSMSKIEQAWERFTLRLKSNDALKAWGSTLSWIIDKLDILLRMYANFVTMSIMGTPGTGLRRFQMGFKSLGSGVVGMVRKSQGIDKLTDTEGAGEGGDGATGAASETSAAGETAPTQTGSAQQSAAGSSQSAQSVASGAAIAGSLSKQGTSSVAGASAPAGGATTVAGISTPAASQTAVVGALAARGGAGVPQFPPIKDASAGGIFGSAVSKALNPTQQAPLGLKTPIAQPRTPQEAQQHAQLSTMWSSTRVTRGPLQVKSPHAPLLPPVTQEIPFRTVGLSDKAIDRGARLAPMPTNREQRSYYNRTYGTHFNREDFDILYGYGQSNRPLTPAGQLKAQDKMAKQQALAQTRYEKQQARASKQINQRIARQQKQQEKAARAAEKAEIRQAKASDKAARAQERADAKQARAAAKKAKRDDYLQRKSEGKLTAGEQYRANLGYGMAIGVTSAVTSIMAGRGVWDDMFGVGEVKDTAADKAIRGGANLVATGLISAIPMVGPILGPVLGPLIGDGIGGWMKKILHKQDLARKAVVEQAEKEIKAIGDVKNSATNLVTLSKTDSKYWSADDWKAWREDLEKLQTLALDEEGGKGFNRFFTELTGESAYGALKNLTKSATEASAALVASAKAATILAEGEAQYNANIEQRTNLHKAQESAETSLSDLQDQRSIFQGMLENAQKRQNEATDVRTKGMAKLDEIEAQSRLSKLDPEISAAEQKLQRAAKKYRDFVTKENEAKFQSQLEAAIYSSGVANLSTEELGNATLEQISYRLLQEWGRLGFGGAFVGGQANSAALDSIARILREKGGYEELLSNPTRTYGQISERAKRLAGDYQEHYKQAMAQNPTEDFKEAAARWAGLGSVPTEVEALDSLLASYRDFIFSSDPTKLAKIAHGFGLTQKSFEALGDVVDIITEADATGTLEAFTDKLKGLVDVFASFVSGSLSSSSVQYLLKNAPSVLLSENGQVDVEGSFSRLVGVVTSGGLASALGGKAWEEAQTDASLWALYKQQVERQGGDPIGDAYKDFASYLLSFDENQATKRDSVIAEFADLVASTSVAYEMYNTLQEKAVELSVHNLQQEIDGLQSIKDSLGNINRQREREIALLKARDALENAKKEKRKVYREGLGFVYEADSQAIKDAQDNLEKLETERRQEDVQYQIDVLKNQQEILNNIQKNKQLEKLEQGFEGWISKDGTFGRLYDIIANRFGGDAVLEKEKKGTVAAASEAEQKKQEADKSAWDEIKKLKPQVDKAVEEFNSLNASPIADYNQKQGAQNAATELIGKYKDLLNGHTEGSAIYENMGPEERAKYNPTDYGLQELDTSDQWVAVWKVGKDTIAQNHNRISLNSLSAFTDSDKQFWQEDAEGKNLWQYYYNNSKDNGWEKVDSLDDVRPGNVARLQRKFDMAGKEYTGVWLAYKGLNGDWSYPKIDENNEPDNRGMVARDGGVFAWLNTNVAYNQVLGASSETSFIPAHASGTLRSSEGPALINELGTEGIVTPYGTLTALPSKTGIVPADLTRNLFDLGSVAPTLIRRIEQKDVLERSSTSSEDNSMNIQNFYAQFETGEGFDMQKLLMQARQYVAVSRQNRNRSV